MSATYEVATTVYLHVQADDPQKAMQLVQGLNPHDVARMCEEQAQNQVDAMDAIKACPKCGDHLYEPTLAAHEDEKCEACSD